MHPQDGSLLAPSDPSEVHLLASRLELRLGWEMPRTFVAHKNQDIRIRSGSMSCYGSSTDRVISPRRSVCFSSFLCDSPFNAVERANSRVAFSFSPNAW